MTEYVPLFMITEKEVNEAGQEDFFPMIIMFSLIPIMEG